MPLAPTDRVCDLKHALDDLAERADRPTGVGQHDLAVLDQAVSDFKAAEADLLDVEGARTHGEVRQR